jgi:phospholipid/cholesterol/gamma-HCH transport system permease protein
MWRRSNVRSEEWSGLLEVRWSSRRAGSRRSTPAVRSCLYRALMEARRQGCEVSIEGLRPDYVQLMNLVSSNWGAIVAEVASRSNGTERFRTSIRHRVAQGARALEFLGESATALVRLVASPGRMRWRSCLE